MLSYLLGNWKQLAGVAVAFTVLGYALHRPAQPAVRLKEQDHVDTATTAAAQQHKDEAPTRVVDRRFAPVCPGQPAQVVREVVTERGRVVTDTATAREEHATADRKLDLTVTPQPRPVWAAAVTMEGLPAGRDLRLSLRRRLFGPFWAEVAVQPAQRSLGAGLAVEW